MEDVSILREVNLLEKFVNLKASFFRWDREWAAMDDSIQVCDSWSSKSGA